MRVCVIGTGHVGLTTCVSLASIGHDLVGTDSDAEKIALLKQGIAPFYEPGLQDLLVQELGSGRLAFSSEASEAVPGAEIAFICVGTPPRANGEANLVAVESAARAAAKHATGRIVIAEKSTVPAGTAERMRRALQHDGPGTLSDIEVVSNPEFLREGRAVRDALEPDRILVGAESEWALVRMRALYAPLVAKGCRLIETDIATAELAKHACNAFLSLRISFANALARLCERSGADVVSVTDVMGTDPRIGSEFLRAGLGFGGSCFHKDLVAFERLASNLGYEFPLLREVTRLNDEAVHAVAARVKELLWNLEGKRVALLGLSFKADTDDVRFSPPLALARLLLEEGATVVGYDPRAEANAKAELPELELAPDPYQAAAGAHCVVLCTGWEEFRSLDLARMSGLVAFRVLVDGRNFFDPRAAAEAGFAYYPTGRPHVDPRERAFA